MPKRKKHKGPLSAPRREVFAQAVARGASILEAYKAAGYVGKDSAAWRLSARPDVKDRVAELQIEAGRLVALGIKDVASYLTEIATSDPRKLFNEKGNIQKIQDWTPEMARSIRSFKVSTKKSETKDSDGNAVFDDVLEVQFWDKIAALKLYGDHIGMFAGNRHAPEDLTELTDDELNKKLIEAQAEGPRLIDVTPNASDAEIIDD